MHNISLKLMAEVTVPGIRVVLVEGWLADPTIPVATDCIPEHSISFWKPTGSGIRAWSRFGPDDQYRPLGNVGFVPARMPYELYLSGQGPGRSVCCYFDCAWFQEITGLGADWSGEQLRACKTLGGPLVSQMLSQLFDELAAPRFGSATMVESLARILSLEVARHVRDCLAASRRARGGLAPWQLNRIHELTRTSGCRVTVQELADACGVSAGHLHHIFKKSTGQTVGEYLEHSRIATGKALLSDGEMTLKQISHHLGFAGPSSFCAAFRRATGETPKAWQRRIRA